MSCTSTQEILGLLRRNARSRGTGLTLRCDSQLYDSLWWNGSTWNREYGEKEAVNPTLELSDQEVLQALKSHFSVVTDEELIEQFSASPWGQT